MNVNGIRRAVDDSREHQYLLLPIPQFRFSTQLPRAGGLRIAQGGRLVAVPGNPLRAWHIPGLVDVLSQERAPAIVIIYFSA